MSAHTTASWQFDDLERARHLAFDPAMYEAICGAVDSDSDDSLRSGGSAKPSAGIRIFVTLDSATEALPSDNIKRIAATLKQSVVKRELRTTYIVKSYLKKGEEETLPAKDPERSIRGLIERIRNDTKINCAQRIAFRLDYLLEGSREEDPEEQAPPSGASLEGFAVFLAKNPGLRYPDIVLTYSGNVRAEWTRGKNEHFAIEFREDEDVRFVIFARDRKHPYKTVQVSGTATIDSVMEQAGYYQVLSWAGSEGKRGA